MSKDILRRGQSLWEEKSGVLVRFRTGLKLTEADWRLKFRLDAESF
jgi:hypothetical protein